MAGRLRPEGSGFSGNGLDNRGAGGDRRGNPRLTIDGWRMGKRTAEPQRSQRSTEKEAQNGDGEEKRGERRGRGGAVKWLIG